VCLGTPWPADYSRAIDMMNRIIMLKKLGVAIHLHYYSCNEPGIPNELNQFCESIHVYERKNGSWRVFFPFAIYHRIRINDKLIANLHKDDYPVLLEGIHCTGVLQNIDTKKRK
jgi:hypothetical protein